jgi:chaperonin GroES
MVEKMKFKPLSDRVLVKRETGQEKTSTGLYIPDSAKEKAQIGAVLAVGDGRADEHGKSKPLAVKVGDKVYFGKYAGTEVIDQDHIVIREDEILGILE